MLIDSQTGKNIIAENDFKNTDVFLEQQKKIGANTGTFIQRIQDKRYITSFENLTDSLFLLSLVEETKAYEASNILKRKSIYFGGFIIAFTILLVMLFSKLFTNNCKSMYWWNGFLLVYRSCNWYHSLTITE